MDGNSFSEQELPVSSYPPADSGEAKSSVLLERIPFFLLIALVFLLPLVFQASLSLAFSKIALISIIVLVAVILMFIVTLKRGSFFWPKSAFLKASLGLACAFIIACFFSGSVVTSFLGNSLEIGTGISILLGISLLFIASRVLRTKGQMFSLYVAFFASLVLVALYQLIRLAWGPGVLSFGIFTDVTSNLIGKWNELGIFFGLGAILSLITLELLRLGRSFRIIAMIMLAVSLFFVGLVNFTYVNIAIAAFALLFCLCFYFLAGAKKGIAKPSLIVLIIALIFVGLSFWGSSFRSVHLPPKLNISQLEVSPSFTQTLGIAGQTLKSKPIASRLLFGAGPNMFQNQLFLYKQPAINLSPFWNIDFSYGMSLVETQLVTTGLVGITAWLIFFGLFLWLGWKTFLKTGQSLEDPAALYLPLSSFFAALYLWIFSIIYVPTGVIFGLTFIFTGIFVASLYEQGTVSDKEIVYLKSRFGLGAVFLIVIGIIGAACFLFVTVKKVTAAFYANDAVTALNQKNDPAAAKNYLEKAIAMDGQPSFYRSVAQIDFLEMNTLLAQQGASSTVIASQFIPLLTNAVQNVEKAESASRGDYQNQVMLGDIYAAVLPLGYPDAYSLSHASYQAALAIDPTNPAILLSLSQLEASNKNISGAATYITKALQEKPNYTAAIYFLAQLQVNQGDGNGALQSLSDLVQLDPTDPTVFYELGYLEYSAGNYSAAAEVLGQSVALENDYSNARYFLGLAYYKLGRISDAIDQFNQILKLNPGNQSVETILANLRAGRAPLPSETAATDQKAAGQKLKNQPPAAGQANTTSTVSNSGSQDSTTPSSAAFQ